MDTAELLQKVRKIEIKTRGLTKHLFSGEYHSAFKGRGMSFSEVRAYQYGDDVRHIDWNVSARTGEPHLKIFEEERELTVMLVVDVSASAFFGTVERTKQAFLTEICALLSFSALSNGDKVGLLMFSDRVELFMPPKKGKPHILRIIRELLNVEPIGKTTELGGALEYLQNVLKKRSICFILSDFQAKNYETPLKTFSRRHDVIGLRATDPREIELPDVGILQVEDPETGERIWIDTSNLETQKKWRDHHAQVENEFKNTFLRSRAEVLSLKTVDSYINALLRFFEKRG
jgi:uncharacterized protein (DUF58 family)